MEIIRKIQKPLSIVLLFALFIVMYNNTVNQHSHRLPNGSLVVHAHPFTKNQNSTPVAKHSHTSSEYTLISFINNIFTLLIFITIVFQEFIFPTTRKFIPKKSVRTSHPAKFYSLLRAPPLG